MIEIVVIGAGLAGLVCAQQLQQAGYQVAVVEKSRGVGGRLATRRLSQGWADHGVRYLESQGCLTQDWITVLAQQGILHPWTDTLYEWRETALHPSDAVYPRYAADQGITAAAKFLAQGLTLYRNQRVQAILPQPDRTWKLILDSTDSFPELTAQAIILAIPAPQALLLLEPLAKAGLPVSMLKAVQSVEFHPCISVIVACPPSLQMDANTLPWKGVTFPDHADLAWIGLDSSKRFNMSSPTFVLQSTASFADRHLEATDLQPIGRQLIHCATQTLLPWLGVCLSDPMTDIQVHRWRYAFVAKTSINSCLSSPLPLPLACCGDWCGGSSTEAALRSGLAAAVEVSTHLQESSNALSLPQGVTKPLAQILQQLQLFQSSQPRTGE